MLPTVALLALLATQPTPPSQAPLSAVLDAERIPLPAGAARATLERRPFERRVVLRLPDAAIPEVARRLAKASRLCPDLERAPGAIVLHCRSPRVRADLETRRWPPTLDLRLLAVYPWRPSEDGPPLVPFELAGLGLGECPGASLEAQGECLLEAGDLAGARERFQAAVAAGDAPLASLRLGDLALRDDDPESALAHWKLARARAPYGRLAQARLCELDARCLASPEAEAVFDPTAVAWPLRADMVIRAARIRVLQGRLGEVARTLAVESKAGLACEHALAWCREVMLLAMSKPGPEGAAALAAWLETPNRTEGPLALALTRAAAAQAEATGAPRYAANLLASMTAAVPEAELAAHLLRTARLFLAAGDRARADEIWRYARAHLGAAVRRDRAWSAVERAVRPASATSASSGDSAPEVDADVAAATAAVQSARLSRLSQGDRP